MSQPLRKRWVSKTPFKHLLLENVLANEVFTGILAFLEGAVWKESRESLFSFKKIPSSADIKSLNSLLFQSQADSLIRFELENALQISLSQPVRLVAQKYMPGSGIGPHTDSEVRAARFILNLNRAWTPSDGGIWLLSDNNKLSPEPEFVAPVSNSGFGFVPGRNTYHALSERNFSDSYALILEFPFGQI